MSELEKPENRQPPKFSHADFLAQVVENTGVNVSELSRRPDVVAYAPDLLLDVNAGQTIESLDNDLDVLAVALTEEVLGEVEQSSNSWDSVHALAAQIHAVLGNQESALELSDTIVDPLTRIQVKREISTLGVEDALDDARGDIDSISNASEKEQALGEMATAFADIGDLASAVEMAQAMADDWRKIIALVDIGIKGQPGALDTALEVLRDYVKNRPDPFHRVAAESAYGRVDGYWRQQAISHAKWVTGAGMNPLFTIASDCMIDGNFAKALEIAKIPEFEQSGPLDALLLQVVSQGGPADRQAVLEMVRFPNFDREDRADILVEIARHDPAIMEEARAAVDLQSPRFTKADNLIDLSKLDDPTAIDAAIELAQGENVASSRSRFLCRIGVASQRVELIKQAEAEVVALDDSEKQFCLPRIALAYVELGELDSFRRIASQNISSDTRHNTLLSAARILADKGRQR